MQTRANPWLFGPARDLLLVCGLGYFAVFLSFAIGGAPLREAQPEFLIPLLTVLLSGPHYGATLLRVYERREDRHAYALFALWATLLVLGFFVWSIYDAVVAAWFFTLYMTWSPWHYTGQNYGIGMMFLGRGGVAVSPLAKRLLKTSFYASFGIPLFAMHTGSGAGYNPNPVDYTSAVVGVSLGVPRAWSEIALAALSLLYVASTLAAFALLSRAAPLRALVPTAALVLTQALWFAIPFSVQFWGIRTGIDPLDAGLPPQYVFWIAIGHALQYQFVTAYFAKSSETWHGVSRYVAKCLAAGAAIWTFPAIVFAPDWLGTREFSSGLSALVAAGVNLHHFILDGAIWKLRSSRVADVLIRKAPPLDPGQVRATLRWPTRVLWGACAAALVVRLGLVELSFFELPSALRSGDLPRAESTLDRMAWFGRDSSRSRDRLAGAFARQGDVESAERQSLRSIELGPNASAWSRLALLRAARGDWPGVVEAFDEAVALAGRTPPTRLVAPAMRAHYEMGHPDRARALFEQRLVADAGAGDLAALAGVAREARDESLAVEAYAAVLARDPERHSAANNLAWILATSEQAPLRDPDRAVALAERAVSLSEARDPNYLDTLATAYAAQGSLGEALATATRAAELARERGDGDLARELQRSAQRYRDQLDAS